jgi:protein-tyrosine phosphatase
VHSAGLLQGGQPANHLSADVLTSRGIDVSAHLSRSMTRELLVGSDLILGMAREHVREAAVLAPEVWPRTFTIKELVRRGQAVGPPQGGEPLDEWLARVHHGRTPTDLTGWSPDDDVADPIGEPRPVYEQMVVELEALVDRLVDLVWGADPAGGEVDDQPMQWARE